MTRKRTHWKRCGRCGYRTGPGELYETDYTGQPLERGLCRNCYEDYVRKATRGSSNHYHEHREDEDRFYG